MAGILERLLGKSEKRRRSAGPAAALLLLALLLVFNLGRIGAAFAAMGDYLAHAFIRRALLVGSMVALCAALLGVILVLRQYSMIGDGLSHVGFGALTAAVAMGTVTADSLPHFLPGGARQAIASLCASIAASPMVFTLAIVVLCAVLLLRFGGRARGDSAVALLATSALAAGVIISSGVQGLNIDVTNYMFGSILAIAESDVAASIGLSVTVLALFVAFYPRIFAVTFDAAFASATGVNARMYDLLIAVLTAVTIVVGMRLMGTMLISSLIIFPALSSMKLFTRFRAVMICSAVISVGCFALGLMLSCVSGLPAGAGIVAVNLAVWVVFALIARLKA